MQQKNWTLRFKDEEYNAWYVTEAATAREILAFLSKKDCTFGLDTETQGSPGFRYHGSDAALCPHRGQLRTIQVSDGKNTVVFDCNTLLPECRPELLAFLGAKRFIAHNALFDLQFLLRLGVRRLNVGCTFIATKLLYHAIHADDSPYRASLDAMVYSLLGEDVSKHMQVSDWSVPDLTFEQVEYAALDPVLCLLISEKLSKGIQKHGLQRIYNLYKEAQLPLAQMQLTGMKFDVETHRDLVGQWTLEAFAAKKEVLKLTGLSDLTASKIAKYLEDNLDPATLRIWPLTESKKLSTDSHTLQDFSHLPIVKPFSKFQKASTLCSTFGAKLAQKLNPKTGRLHTQFKLCGARTGRLSSSAPNLQNAPRDEAFRKLFIPEKGNKLVICDFGQIELRVAAELSQDKVMLQAYREGIDLHALTASKVSKKKLEEVTKAERQLAKAINFGLLFGLGKQKFSKYARQSYGVDVTEAEAEEAIETFRTLYCGYREWQLLQASNAETSLSCTTPFGKKRRLAEGDTYGTSMNQPVQGGAAEVMFCSLIAFTKNASENMQLINVVHDEIIVECPMNIADKAKEILEQSMTEGFLEVFPKGITNKLVEAKVVDNWSEKK